MTVLLLVKLVVVYSVEEGGGVWVPSFFGWPKGRGGRKGGPDLLANSPKSFGMRIQHPNPRTCHSPNEPLTVSYPPCPTVPEAPLQSRPSTVSWTMIPITSTRWGS